MVTSECFTGILKAVEFKVNRRERRHPQKGVLLSTGNDDLQEANRGGGNEQTLDLLLYCDKSIICDIKNQTWILLILWGSVFTHL